MTQTKGGAAAPVRASVVALEMADFGRKSPLEQASARAQLEALTGVALQPLAAGNRIVLDAGRALALALLGGPVEAAALAERARAAAGELPLRVGIDYGPLAAVEDPERGEGLAGDGLDGALALAGQADPGAVLSSARFRAALEAETAARGAARAQRRGRTALFAGAASLLLALGAGGRALRPPPPPPVVPALLQFDIRPRGEVYVDGRSRGPTPPLLRLEVAPGPHTLEVRNGAFAPLQLELHLAAAERMTIRHEFAAPKPPPPRRPRKEANKVAKKEQAKKDVDWGRNIRSDFENMKRKLGF